MLVTVNIFFREFAVKMYYWLVPALTAVASLTALTKSTPAMAGLTASDAETLAPKNQVVGQLPYSNQWVFDQRQSYLYLSYNHGQMAAPIFHTGSFDSNFNNQNFDYPSLDYFVNLFSFANSESKSFFGRLSLWTRYGFGVGMRRGELLSGDFTVENSAESSYLTALVFRLGPQLTFDLADWIQPYAGLEFSPFVFRHSSSLSGAESQGAGTLFGPVAGVHLPLFFSHRASIYGEMRRTLVLSDDKHVFGSSTTFGAGLGMVF
ncbi:MAG: hypothetical protein HY074_11445 [Deltaproteobacteria bacterium]|nr:hypothetical protein [Deltaproteobacteria bacterium]